MPSSDSKERMKACVALVLGLVVAGGDASAKVPSAPADLVVEIAVGDAKALEGVRAYLDAVVPGSGAQAYGAMRGALASIAGARSLDGLDAAAPMYVLVVEGKAARGAAILGKVADARLLAKSAGSAHTVRKQGWAMLGPKPVVDAVADYGFGALAPAPSAASPRATVYVRPFLANHAAEIVAARSSAAAGNPMMGELAGMMFDGVISVLGDCDKLVVVLEANQASGAIDLAFVPRAGTRLAAFVAAQRPSDFALLAKLPDVAAGMLMVGHFESGPYRQSLLDLMTAMSKGSPPDVIAMWSALMTASTGDIAAAGHMVPAFTLIEVFGIGDRKAYAAAIDGLVARTKRGLTTETLGVTQTIKTAGSVRYGGATVRGFEVTYDLSKAPAETRRAMERTAPGGKSGYHMATVDKLGILAMSATSLADAKRAVDVAQGKAKPLLLPATIASALTGSRARKDSFAMVLDMGAFLGVGISLPITLSSGFADRSAHFRITTAPDVWRTVVQQQQSPRPVPAGPT
jgi:hypothetical protein